MRRTRTSAPASRSEIGDPGRPDNKVNAELNTWLTTVSRPSVSDGACAPQQTAQPGLPIAAGPDHCGTASRAVAPGEPDTGAEPTTATTAARRAARASTAGTGCAVTATANADAARACRAACAWRTT
ncbi:hypothetical protein B1R94_14925 [Mycolicibacterium litorale]|nr:hypothetical protein B1R94_14925 [Mycolicibacterium litorale]